MTPARSKVKPESQPPSRPRKVVCSTANWSNSSWFNAGYGSKAERDMKAALHRGGRETLNFYSTTASVYLGWAFFPNLSESRLNLDGIVVDWESVPGTSTPYVDRYDQGKTGTHEAGHWLNMQDAWVAIRAAG